MKSVLFAVGLLVLGGCANEPTAQGTCEKVTLYAADGKVIKSWFPERKSQTNGGGYLYFIGKQGMVYLSGTVIVEEAPCQK